MKRLLASVLLSSMLFLTSCSSDSMVAQSKPTNSSETTTQAPPPPAAPQTSETNVPSQITQQQALLHLRDGWPYFNTVSDASILGLFDSICSALDSGASLESIVSAGTRSNVPAEEVGAAIGFAALSTCYHHARMVFEWAES